MADDSEQGAAVDTSKVSNFLQIEVAHPFTREGILEAVAKALDTQLTIPTFQAGTTGSVPALSASAETRPDDDCKDEKKKSSLLMLLHSQGPE